MKNIEDKAKMKKSESKCPVFAQCGACSHIDVPYNVQLKTKQEQIEKFLGSYGSVNRIVGMKDPYHYRYKVNAVFQHKKDGSVVAGNFSEGSHLIVPVSKCYIENLKADEIINTIAGLCRDFKIKIYNEDTGIGLMRYAMIRIGHATGQIMVILVTADPMFPSKANFIKVLRSKHPEITTIVQNINDRTDSMVLGARDTVLYGGGYIEDRLCGKTFRISPHSFYQVNPVQTELLYRYAVDAASLTGHETVLDAYCGTGTIGLIAADKASEVIGVELEKSAVRDAISNAKVNKVKNITFYNNDAGEFITQLDEQGKKLDVVFMDPPRSGSSDVFINVLRKAEPRRIVYVSCNPVTLARDLELLTKGKKYAVKSIQPFDCFPHTEHVECVVLMSRVN